MEINRNKQVKKKEFTEESKIKMKVFSLYKLRFFIYSTFRVTVYRNIYLQEIGRAHV